MPTFAQLLAETQTRKELTDTDLAAILRVSQPTVTRWRNGRDAPRERYHARLARFLGITEDEVAAIVADSTERPKPLRSKGETLPDLLLQFENDNGYDAPMAWQKLGVERSRYYRFRTGASVPSALDIPQIARKLGVGDERLALAVYRTEIARAKR